MASPSSSSSSSSSSASSSSSCCSNEAKDTEQPRRRPHFVPNCVYPFLRPALTPKPTGSSPPPSPPPITVHQLHDAVASAIDNCSTRLRHLLASTFSSSRFLNLKPHFIQVRRAGWGNGTTSLGLGLGLGFAAVLPGDSVAGLVVANGVLSFLSLYNTLLVVRLVLTWFPNAPPAIVSPLSTLCDPYLNIFRGIIPPLGGTLDLSPILAFLVLEAFTSTAKALPAELPPAGSAPQQRTPSSKRSAAAGLTSLQEKWLRRLHGKNSM